ncbi:hypothetical protein B0F90DRAFT_1688647 [Multifurca ochricompacta]|uniref:Uncharacterized protein n=1 Tax=Multifurca ochricompacta TaxID=376703 RepID=A0AAD4MA03_9AGAM|nr:hypothetical protein B0F90DRAFT_1688647 [Multifurca ochricompacta]
MKHLHRAHKYPHWLFINYIPFLRASRPLLVRSELEVTWANPVGVETQPEVER